MKYGLVISLVSMQSTSANNAGDNRTSTWLQQLACGILDIVCFSLSLCLVSSDALLLTILCVLQARFQEYLALSESFLKSATAKGFTDTLPLVSSTFEPGLGSESTKSLPPLRMLLLLPWIA